MPPHHRESNTTRILPYRSFRTTSIVAILFELYADFFWVRDATDGVRVWRALDAQRSQHAGRGRALTLATAKLLGRFRCCLKPQVLSSQLDQRNVSQCPKSWRRTLWSARKCVQPIPQKDDRLEPPTLIACIFGGSLRVYVHLCLRLKIEFQASFRWYAVQFPLLKRQEFCNCFVSPSSYSEVS